MDNVISDAAIVPTGTTQFKADASVIMNPDFKVEQGKIYEAQIEPCSPGNWEYQYRIADHLNNTRVVFVDQNNNGTITEDEIIQEMHYSPYGRPLTGDWNNRERHDYQYKYNDKELVEDFGLNHADYGNRWQSMDWIDFTTIDRFADRYPWQSPYVHSARNPINLIDINGDSVQVFFESGAARDAFIDIMNNGLEGQFEVSISDNGIISFVASENGGDVSKLSKNGKEFHSQVGGILSAKGVVALDVAYGDPSVHTGSFYQKTIDVGDMLQFNQDPNKLGETQNGKMAHEFVEQYYAQIKGHGFIFSHDMGVGAENRVNQSIREDLREYSPASVTQTFTREGRTVNTTITIKQAGGFFNLFRVNRPIVEVNNR